MDLSLRNKPLAVIICFSIGINGLLPIFPRDLRAQTISDDEFQQQLQMMTPEILEKTEQIRRQLLSSKTGSSAQFDELGKYIAYPDIRVLPRGSQEGWKSVGSFDLNDFRDLQYAAMPMNLGFGRYSLGFEFNAWSRTPSVVLSQPADKPGNASDFYINDLDTDALRKKLEISGSANQVVLEELGLTVGHLDQMTAESALLAFNAILQMPDFYSRLEGDAESLPTNVKKMIVKMRETRSSGKPVGVQEMRAFNRSLLQAIYPDETRESRAAWPRVVWSHSLYRLIADEAVIRLQNEEYLEINDYYVQFKHDAFSLLKGDIRFQPARRGRYSHASLQELIGAVYDKGIAISLGGMEAKLFFYRDHREDAFSLIILTASECNFKAYAFPIPADIGSELQLTANIDGVEISFLKETSERIHIYQKVVDEESYARVLVCPIERPDRGFVSPEEALKRNMRYIQSSVWVPPPMIRLQDMNKSISEKEMAEIKKYYATGQGLHDFDGSLWRIFTLGSYVLAEEKMGQLVPDIFNNALREPKRWVRDHVHADLEFVDNWMDPSDVPDYLRDQSNELNAAQSALDRGFTNGLGSLNKALDRVLQRAVPSSQYLIVNTELGRDAYLETLVDKVNSGSASEADRTLLRNTAYARHFPAGQSRVRVKVRPELGSGAGLAAFLTGPLAVGPWLRFFGIKIGSSFFREEEP